nr:MAG TPA: tail protein [Caudoviricetes sp.]
MLKIQDYNAPKILYPLELEPDKWSVTHKYNGYDILSFEIPDSHEAYKYIAEEVRIFDGQNRYIVKNIDERSRIVTVDCQIDLDDWRERFWTDFRRTEITISDALNIIKPVNWSIADAGKYPAKKTIEASEGRPIENANSEDLMLRILELYGLTATYDSVKRIMYVVDPGSYTPGGEYITDELNLRSLGYTGNSTDFATRLYAYGKPDEETDIPLSIASVNGGKEYVEDHSYSDRVISIGWKDERYTKPESLLAAATEKLKKLAFPVRSYECDVINLDEDVWLYKMVTLIDRKRNIRVNHQVIEYREYPDNHSLDVVTLSTTPPRVQGTINQIRNEITDQAEQTKTTLEVAIDVATQLITGQRGGYVVLDPPKRPEQILIMDKPDKAKAGKCWRWNLAGLGYSKDGMDGPYDLAITMNGAIVADYITVGTLSGIKIQGNEIIAGSQNDADGVIRVKSGDGSTEYVRLDSTGLTAIHGNIAGWTIEQYRLRNEGAGMNSNGHGMAFWAGGTDITGETATFRVSHDGRLFSSQATINGGEEENVTCQVLNHNQQYVTQMFGQGMHIKKVDGSGWIAKIGTAGVGMENGSEKALMTPKFVSVSNDRGAQALSPDGVGPPGGTRSLLTSEAIEISNGGSGSRLSPDGVDTKSLASIKQNIRPAINLLDEVMDTDIYKFEFRDSPGYELQGFVIGDGYRLTPKVLSRKGDAINMYTAVGVLWGAVKELNEKVERMMLNETGKTNRDYHG